MYIYGQDVTISCWKKLKNYIAYNIFKKHIYKFTCIYTYRKALKDHISKC